MFAGRLRRLPPVASCREGGIGLEGAEGWGRAVKADILPGLAGKLRLMREHASRGRPLGRKVSWWLLSRTINLLGSYRRGQNEE